MIFLRWILGVGALASVLSACSAEGGSTGVTPSSTTVSPRPSAAASTASDTSAAGALGCTQSGGGIPADAAVAEIIDVDGDHLPDRSWLQQSSGHVTFGITTATDSTATTPIDLTGGGPRSALVADYDGQGDIIAFVSDGRTADLFAYSACTLVTIQNPEDTPYQFDLGFRGTGTGVGCVDASGDGVRDVVGLNVVVDGSGQATSIDRTVIHLDGPRASNGARDSVPVTDPATADLARQITCGDLTMAANGVSLAG